MRQNFKRVEEYRGGGAEEKKDWKRERRKR
jgi:hypothetical protein